MPSNFSIPFLHKGYKEKEFSAKEIARSFLRTIKEKDGGIGAYLSLFEDRALLEAERVDGMIARGEPLPPLAGIPLAIKDNIMMKGLRTTAASKILEDYTASYDATVIEKLKDDHAVFLGKTNLDEFAMGASTENSGFQVTKNPHDVTRVPGGSSGGSAAAVAAGFAVAALGSDTGGSIRQPAAFCGVVGLKPTYGAVSRFGLIAMTSSLDQIGSLARTAEDAAILYDAIKGGDPMDATSVFRNQIDTARPDFERVKKLAIGIPKEYFVDGTEKEVIRGIENAIDRFKKEGFSVKEVSLPHIKYSLSCYYIIVPAEISANLARFDGIRYSRISRTGTDVTRGNTDSPYQSASSQHRSALAEIYFSQRGEGFGMEVKRRVLLGTFVLSSGYYDAYYAKAQKVRRLITEDFDRAFEDVDVLLAPVAPSRAFKIGEKVSDPLSMYLEDIFTVPVNLAGLPALSLPVKLYPLGGGELPVGFQLIGKRFHEPDILGLGMWYEKE